MYFNQGVQSKTKVYRSHHITNPSIYVYNIKQDDYISRSCLLAEGRTGEDSGSKSKSSYSKSVQLGSSPMLLPWYSSSSAMSSIVSNSSPSSPSLKSSYSSSSTTTAEDPFVTES